MKRYAFAGASGRALSMYALPLRRDFAPVAALVGAYDVNRTRADLLGESAGGVPLYDDFDRLLTEARPDAVIVTTVDRYHHEFIIRSLRAGADAITEKPMTIDAEKCRAILAAERETGRRVTVTFNYRFAPYPTRVAELLRQGAIGRALAVDFEWFLDTRHGADYFRRWHRRKENSGGLLVHKASHHFDLVNWWLEDEPRDAFAFGDRRVYGPTRTERGERCSTCPYAATCEFYADFASDPKMQQLYFRAEHEDGYYRDGCVFAEDIDIEDTMSATVRYRGGALLSYSLIAYAPYEGWRLAINGTNGRLEAEEFHSGPFVDDPVQHIRLVRGRGEIETIEVPKALGGHGGGDERLRDYLFSPEPPPDPLGYTAGSRAGAMSLLVGHAANRSIATGQPVAIDDLLRGDG
ncbi:MAG TPA: Gfo/Idh/MocA family oxidoreductase [Chloroflexota bacterium]|jgi:predicted dehydrogenase